MIAPPYAQAESLWEQRRAYSQRQQKTKSAQEQSKALLLAQLSEPESGLAFVSFNPLHNPNLSSAIPEKSVPIPKWIQSIPQANVQFEDAYFPEGWTPLQRVIVHIQDAHENYEAQKNIVKFFEEAGQV